MLQVISRKKNAVRTGSSKCILQCQQTFFFCGIAQNSHVYFQNKQCSQQHRHFSASDFMLAIVYYHFRLKFDHLCTLFNGWFVFREDGFPQQMNMLNNFSRTHLPSNISMLLCKVLFISKIHKFLYKERNINENFPDYTSKAETCIENLLCSLVLSVASFLVVSSSLSGCMTLTMKNTTCQLHVALFCKFVFIQYIT